MKILAGLIIALSLLLGASAQARTFELGQPAVASITLPDDWNPKRIRKGAEATSPDDEEVYVAIEVWSVAKVEDAVVQTLGWLMSEGVKIDPKTEKQQQGKINDIDIVDLAYSGKDKDGDETKISVSVLVVNPTTILVLTYWGSESGERKHGATLDAILKSIKRTN